MLASPICESSAAAFDLWGETSTNQPARTEDQQPDDREQEGETPVDPVDHFAPPFGLKPAVTENVSPRDRCSCRVVLPFALDTSVTFESHGRLASRSRTSATLTCEDATPVAEKPDAPASATRRPGGVVGAAAAAPGASGVGDCADRLCR